MPRTDTEAIDVAMQRVYASLKPASLSCSIGIAFAQKGETIEALMKRADQAVYAAKAAGKNQYIVR